MSNPDDVKAGKAIASVVGSLVLAAGCFVFGSVLLHYPTLFEGGWFTSHSWMKNLLWLVLVLGVVGGLWLFSYAFSLYEKTTTGAWIYFLILMAAWVLFF